MADYVSDPDILKIIRKFQTVTPIDVVKIAQELGIEIYTSDFKGMPLAGKIFQQDGKYIIYVNVLDSIYRKRFTIAHEIAHYILHQDKIGDGIIDDALYRSGLSNEIEVQANKLAADILMPWHLINEKMTNDIQTIKQLAEIFRVSESAMAIRLGIPV